MTIGITKEQLIGLAMIGCTQREMAAALDCHHNTVAEHVTKHFNCDFKTFFEMFLDKSVVSLKRTIWKDGLKGGNGARAVYCLKLLAERYLDMREGMNLHNTHSAPGGGPIQTVVVPPTQEELIAELKRRGLPTEIFSK